MPTGRRRDLATVNCPNCGAHLHKNYSAHHVKRLVGSHTTGKGIIPLGGNYPSTCPVCGARLSYSVVEENLAPLIRVREGQKVKMCCSRCRAEVPPYTIYCLNCGVKLEEYDEDRDILKPLGPQTPIKGDVVASSRGEGGAPLLKTRNGSKVEMHCPKCGAKVEPYTIYCLECGTKLQEYTPEDLEGQTTASNSGTSSAGKKDGIRMLR